MREFGGNLTIPVDKRMQTDLWWACTTVLQKTIKTFDLTVTELYVIDAVVERSWRWGRFGEYMTPYIFQHGYVSLFEKGCRCRKDKVELYPLQRSRRHLLRARCALRDYGLLLWETQTQGRIPHPYIINLPGLVSLWKRQIVDRQPVISYRWEKVLKAGSIARYAFSRAGVKTPVIAGRIEENMSDAIEDAIEAGRERSRKKVRVRMEKARQKGKNVSVPSFVEYMRGVCIEHAVRMYARFTKKDLGQIKNYLKECRANDIDPFDEIFNVIKFWSHLGRDVRTDDGRVVVFGEMFIFQKFYRYRIPIIEWLWSSRSQEAAEVEDVESQDVDLDSVDLDTFL